MVCELVLDLGKLGMVGRTLKLPRDVDGIKAEPDPYWSLDELLQELKSLYLKLSSSPLPFNKTKTCNVSGERSAGKQGGCFHMRVFDEEFDITDHSDEENHDRSSITTRRFGFDDLYLSDSEDENDLVLQDHSHLMKRVGLVQGALLELTHEHDLQLKEDVRSQVTAFAITLLNEYGKISTALIIHIRKYRDARRDLERRFDTQYNHKIAQDLDSHLTTIKREYELKSQIEERKIRSDAGFEEAKRQEKALQLEKLRQEKAKAEAEDKRRVAEGAKFAALEAEKMAAKEAAKKEANDQRLILEATKKQTNVPGVNLNQSKATTSNGSKKTISADSRVYRVGSESDCLQGTRVEGYIYVSANSLDLLLFFEPRSIMADDENNKPEPQPSPDDEEAEASAGLKSLSIADESKIEFLEDPDDSNINVVANGDTPYTSAMTFEDLNLSPELLKGLYDEMHFTKPSKIQAVSLRMILTPPYKDLIAQAHNGSGKTTCFVLGMLSRVDTNQKFPQALCICPTRELAIQNIQVLQKMGKYTGITSECAVPKDSASRVPASKRPVVMSQVVIGTPGTISSLISTKKLSVNYLRILVFDEADHMLAEDGFKDDSLRIMKAIERNNYRCQVLLFSATFSEAVKNFVPKVVKDHNQIFVKKEELSLGAIKQYKVNCQNESSKIIVIKDKILELKQKDGQTIIFVRSRDSARKLHNALVDYGYDVSTLQGALNQAERDKIVQEFKDRLTQVLIATDLLARGFDQPQVNLVVNYDLPIKYETREPDYEVYLHRIGRAGRFGRKGVIFNLMCLDADRRIVEQIENHYRIRIEEVDLQSDKTFVSALEKAGLV